MNKIAVCGKGGVGKTTLTSLLVYSLEEDGKKVYAIDADPNPTLAEALGMPYETIDKITPIIEMKELIAERTGAKTGEYGSYFKLNPYVKDIPQKFSVNKGNINLLIMGAMRGADKGCACAQNAMLKALVTHLMISEKEAVVMDMVAGTEHLGRGTAKSVDAMIIVVEPGMRSIKVAKEFYKMSKDLGIKNIYVVGNKVSCEEDKDYIKMHLVDYKIVGFIPTANTAVLAERQGVALYEISEEMRKISREILDKVLLSRE